MTQNLTFLEALLTQAVALNSVVLPVSASCDVMIVSGPQRMANQSPQEVRALAQTSLNGYSTKVVVRDAVDAATPLTTDKTLAFGSGVRAIGSLVTIAGAQNTFRRGSILLDFSGTGVANVSVVVYPKDYRCQFLILHVTDNGNVGQIAASDNYTMFYDASDHPGTVASEFVMVMESLNMRDFTSRT